MTDLNRIYFVVGDSARNIYSHTWRVWWHGSSFYIKSRNKTMGYFKVSMHGPDERYPDPGFIVGRDQSASVSPDALLVDRGRFLGSRFSGKPMPDGGLLLVTFRFGAELFAEGMPSEHVEHVKDDDKQAALLVPAPAPGEFSGVHLFLTRQGMRIPGQEAAQEANAFLGSLVNKNEDVLTGVGWKWPVEHCPRLEDLQLDPPVNENDRGRGFATMVGDDGRLWIVEKWLSKKAIEKESFLSKGVNE
jgi:hypothetical protein